MTIVVTSEGFSMRHQHLRDAKAHLSATVRQATRGEPTAITVRGKPAAVVVGYDEFLRLRGGEPSLAELLLAYPGEEGDIERDRRPAPAFDL